MEPEVWNHIRRAVDDRGAAGQFILTGSAVPADDVTRGVEESLRAIRDYLEEIRRVEIRRVDGSRRDPERVGRLLRWLLVTATFAMTTSP